MNFPRVGSTLNGIKRTNAPSAGSQSISTLWISLLSGSTSITPPIATITGPYLKGGSLVAPNHRCRSGENCVARGPDEAALTVKPNTLCNPCIGQLQHQYDELPEFYRKLRDFFLVNISTSDHGSKINSTPGLLVPFNVAVLDLLDEIDVLLDRYGGLRIDNLICRPSQEFSVWRSGRPRKEWLDGVDQALAIRAVWRKADGVIKVSKPRTWRQWITLCPKCRRRTLGQFSEDDFVTCSSCGGVMSVKECKRVTLIQADQEKKEKKGIN